MLVAMQHVAFALLVTPFGGEVAEHCVYEVPSGTLVDEDATGLVLSHPEHGSWRHTPSAPCTSPLTHRRKADPITCSDLPCNNWIDNAGWQQPAGATPIGGFSARYNVPQSPAKRGPGQVLFYFIGAENTDGEPRHGQPPPSGRAILQPVLTFDPDGWCKPSSTGWCFSSWYCCPKNLTTHTPFIQDVVPSDSFFASFNMTANGSAFTVSGTSDKTGQVASLSCPRQERNFNWADVTLEVYQITECEMFSPGEMVFGDLTLWDTSFAPLTPEWALSPTSPCSGSVIVDPEFHGAVHISHRTWAERAAPIPPTTRLNDGNLLPMVSLGGGYNDSDTATSIVNAVAAGFRGIDTALTYFDETGVKDGLSIVLQQHDRSELFITTKVPGCPADTAGCKSTTKAGHAANLKLLGLDSVDLLLVHWGPLTGCSADPATSECRIVRAQWSALQELRAEGLTTSIGVSNYCQACLDCLLTDPATSVVPSVNQFELHVGMHPDPEGLVSYTISKGILPMAYSPLGPTFNDSAKSILITGELVTSIGALHNKSGAQVSLRYLTQRGVPLITRSLKSSHLEADLDIFDWNLTAADVEKLDAATEPYAPPCLFCAAGNASS